MSLRSLLILQQLRKHGRGLVEGPFLRQHQHYPYALFLREELSTASKSSKYQSPGTATNSTGSTQPVGSQDSAQPGGSPGSRNQALKLLLGSAAVVAAITTAFYAEWPGNISTGRSERQQVPILNNEIKQSDMKSSEVVHDGHIKDEASPHSKEDFTSSNHAQEKEQVSEEGMKESDDSHEAHPRQDELEGMQQQGTTQDSGVHKDSEANGTVGNMLHAMNDDKQEVKDSDSLNPTKDDMASVDEVLQKKASESNDFKEVNEHKDGKQEVAAGVTLNAEKDNEISAKPYDDILASKRTEQGNESHHQTLKRALSETYFLGKENEENSQRFSNEDDYDSNSFSEQKEDAKEGKGNAKELDGVLVLNFLEAVHAAEQRQAEIDAHMYDAYKKTLKEKYEKELKDARARELMYAEEADSLEKELHKEKAKAAAAFKSLQEKAEQRLVSELQRKEEEADMKLKKAQLLAKAEKAAAIAKEKSSHLNEMADANLQINALRTAFYTRSEEARQSHSVHRLALGTFALEDALMKGAPLHKEIAVLRASMEGIDKDSLLEVALSSLPPETLTRGTETQAQLHQRFESLEEALRELALIPSGGGGVLTHALARLASAVKVKEAGDGFHCESIESTIARVEHFLAEGNLIEAANALEKGTKGSKAEIIAAEWARQTRNRAVTEQALSLLQAYATAIASSLT